MSPPRLGVIGAGMGAKPHGQALAELQAQGRLEVAGVYSRGPASRAAFAAAHGFPVAPDLAALIEDPSITALMILTPPDARLDLLRAAAEAGKHVLCEKPLGRTAAEAAEAVAICAAAGTELGIVFQHRYRAASQKLAQLLETGALGPIHTVALDVPWWRDQAYYDVPGRGSYARDGGGVLISQAIHTLDLMLALVTPSAGPVTEIQAMAGTSGFHQMEAEDLVAAGLRFAGGALGTLTASTADFPGGPESIRLGCAKASARLQAGTLRLEWHDGRVEQFGDAAATGGGADPMAFPYDWHRDLIAGFLEALAHHRTPSPSGRDALRVHEVISAIIRSSHEGHRIALDAHT